MNPDRDGTGSIALVTGVSRRIGIGHALARRLASDGHRVVAVGWRAYDDEMPWGADPLAPGDDAADAMGLSLAAPFREVDFADAATTDALLPEVAADVGPVSTLVMSHCYSVDSDIDSTTVESFDRHMAVNARATWQLIRGFAKQFPGPAGTGRIVAITSDHTAHNLPYGASKGAMDRIVLAAAHELADLGVTANVINPGGTDTGWMSVEIERLTLARNLQPRVGLPSDVANLVGFLCSPDGQWINGQLLYSDGGLR